VLCVVQGEAPVVGRATKFRETFLVIAPMLVLVALSLVMGVAMPPAIQDLVRDAAEYAGGGR
jgi:hypothetical protein